MCDERSKTALEAYLEHPAEVELRAALEELTDSETDALFNLAVAAQCAGPGVSCSVNIVPDCNIQRALAVKVKPGEGFVLCFYRDAHFVGLKVITLYGVTFDKVVKCGPGVLKPLFESAVEKLNGLNAESTDKPQFVGWAMRQVPLPCRDWDVAT